MDKLNIKIPTPRPRARSLTRPTIQPRPKDESIGNMFDKKRLQKSKSLPHPQAKTYTPKPTPRVAKTMDVLRKQPNASPDDNTIRSLFDLVVWNSRLLPARVKVVTGHVAENHDQPNIDMGDVFTVHGIKQSKVVTIKDSKCHVHNVPLYSTAKFGIVGDNVESDEYLCTYTFQDLLTAKPQPRVIASLNSYHGCKEAMSFEQYEVLIVNNLFDVSESSQMGGFIGAFSVTSSKQKFIPNECNVLFTSDPAATQLYLSEIFEHAPHLLPCRARLIVSDQQMKFPKYLTTDLVTIESLQSETSFITSLHCYEGDMASSSQSEIYVDIPTSISIDVLVENATTEDPYRTISFFNFEKYQSCLDTAEDNTTSSQVLKVLRKGYEKAGTNIHVPGVQENNVVLQTLITVGDSDDVYDDVLYVSLQANSENKKLEKCTSEDSSVLYSDVVHGENLSLINFETKRMPRPVHYKKTAKQETQKPMQSSKASSEKKVAFNPIIQMLNSALATGTKSEAVVKDKPKTGINSKTRLFPFRKKQPVLLPTDKKSSNHSLTNPKMEATSRIQESSTPPRTVTRFDVQDISETLARNSHQTALDCARVRSTLRQQDQLSIVPSSRKKEGAKSTVQDNSKHGAKESGKSTTIESVRTQLQVSSKVETTTQLTQERRKSDEDHTSAKTKPTLTRSDVAREQSDLSLQTMNKMLFTIMDKLEKIEERQTQFEERLTELNKVKQKGIPKVVSTMTQLDVQNLLDAMDMSQYKEAFSREWVNGKVFMELDDDSLETLGVTSKLHRNKLLKMISTGIALN